MTINFDFKDAPKLKNAKQVNLSLDAEKLKKVKDIINARGLSSLTSLIEFCFDMIIEADEQDRKSN